MSADSHRAAEKRVVRAAMRLYNHWRAMRPLGIGERHWYPLNSEPQAKSLGRACAALANRKRK